MQPAINIQSFGTSWWDTAKTAAESAKETAGDWLGDTAAEAAAGTSRGVLSELEATGTRIASTAAQKHAAELAAAADPAMQQAQKTMRWIGIGAVAIGVGALIFFVSRRKRRK